VSTNFNISPKTKKILAGIGITFGTVMVFLLSFVLAFSLIVNPINFMTVSDADTVEENEKLKEQVQTLNDEVEHLNAAVDRYKTSSSAPAVIVTPDQSTSKGQNQNSVSDQVGKNGAGNASGNTQEGGSGQKADTESENASSGFSPETVTATDEKTPEDVEVPITVIDISE
jgi:hypothetical protein